jgi:hypothetical protein
MSAPVDMLTHLLVFVRQPNEDGSPTDDYQWCYASAVHRWQHGFVVLAKYGYVETKMVSNPDDPHDMIGSMAVRFTTQGLNFALDANVPEGTRVEQDKREVVERADRNAGVEGFGQF